MVRVSIFGNEYTVENGRWGPVGAPLTETLNDYTGDGKYVATGIDRDMDVVEAVQKIAPVTILSRLPRY